MKVLVAGAAGAIGKQLVPRLVAAGHEVFGMTRSAANEALGRGLGATPLIADALDPDQVAGAVAAAEPAAGPAERVEIEESLSVAFLVLLESLTPEERAVLILHDVFDYGYGEVAEIVGKSEDNARQLAVRARRHLERRPHRFEGSGERREELGDRFFAAAEEGDLGALEALLARDVVLRGDGGGRVPALARALHGAGRVAGTLANWNRQGARGGGSMRRATINGLPGTLMLDGAGRLIGAMSVEAAGGEIVGVNSVVNPEKLRHLGQVGDMWGMLGADR